MSNDQNCTLSKLKNAVRKFIVAREWEKYHNPKDIAESICIEAAELLELFQWRSPSQIEEKIKRRKFVEKIASELADIIIYSLSMANVTGIDITEAILKKLEKNERRYPVQKYRGKAYVDE